MPNFNIVKKNTADKTSFRVQSIIGMFDLPNEHLQETFTGEINIDNADWNVGIIYGASGTGKSTIAKELFGENIFMDDKHEGLSVIDEMPKNKSVKDITKAFCACGFSSPPSWLKPYHVLSNGEKMRVDLAKTILSEKDLVVFDEFTSVVNREVAKVGSFAIQKAVRRAGKKFIAVSCHDDVIDWLEPDWTLCTDNMKFEWCKKKDQKSSAPSRNAAKIYGKCLGNITI